MRLFALLLAAFAPPAAAAPEESVKFVPHLKIYECPPEFQYRSECEAHEKILPPQKVVLNLQVLNQRMGQWNFEMNEPAPVSFRVIVVRGREGKNYDYSVSAEAGTAGSPMPFSNSRTEFSENTAPRSFGVASAPAEREGKKYLAEIRLTDFHGKLPPLKK